MDPVSSEDSFRVILQGPGNWHLWINIIKTYAAQRDVWALIDLSSQNRPAFVKSTESTFHEVNPGAAALIALTAVEIRAFEILIGSYKTRLQIWRDQSKALAAVRDHIRRTVGSYLETIQQTRDVATQLSPESPG